MLNTICIKSIDEDAARRRIYQVLVDDAPLVDLFRDYEAQYSQRINGAYTDALSEKALQSELCTAGSRFMPLGCDCGVTECWFVTGEVLTFDEYVSWGRWENPYRDKRDQKSQGLFWSYKAFPDLVFDANQYKAAIARALKE
ncbi:MAG: hypothetical protein HWE26_03720 [Alteromonadaceae bacterium]|nr:hypothetical protein [Alteromonadaceae bacterium]